MGGMEITMQASEYEKNLYGQDIAVIQRTDDCTVYRVETANGRGVMTSYGVFPGVDLIYNDFQTFSYHQDIHIQEEIMEINHCRKGRFECEFQRGTYGYLDEGDLAVNMCHNRVTASSFPLEHYHGVAVIISLDKASAFLSSVFEDISIDLYSLRDRLCPNNRCFIMRAKAEIRHIFAELYTIPREVQKGYFKLKVLELLLFLSITELSEQKESRQYFPKKQVEVVKQIKKYMTDNLEKRFSMEELSERFHMGLTSMKLCFKGVYGTPIFTYIKVHRIQAAASMLHQSNDSIATIAGKVGYENASKFAAAFKDILGVSPIEYRKNPPKEYQGQHRT